MLSTLLYGALTLSASLITAGLFGIDRGVRDHTREMDDIRMRLEQREKEGNPRKRSTRSKDKESRAQFMIRLTSESHRTDPFAQLISSALRFGNISDIDGTASPPTEESEIGDDDDDDLYESTALQRLDMIQMSTRQLQQRVLARHKNVVPALRAVTS